MKRIVKASIAALACACNSAPKETCVPYMTSAVSAGNSPSTCDKSCVSVPLYDASLELCTTDCTFGGTAACSQGMTCVADPLSPRSYCVFTCGDGGSCPSPQFCYVDAGVCL